MSMRAPVGGAPPRTRTAREQMTLDDEFPLGDGTADTEAEVSCPYCGEVNEIGVDPGSGAIQDYVEDCQVCCQPWHVHVTYDEAGGVHVHVETADDA